MQMKMKHGLARSAPVVHHCAVAFEQIALARELRCHKVEFPEDTLILCGGFMQRSKMFFWTNQDVRGRLRADVFKGKYICIFVNNLGGDLFACDFAEKTIGAHRLPPEDVPSSRRTTNGVNPSRLRSCSPNWRAASSPETLPTRTR